MEIASSIYPRLCLFEGFVISKGISRLTKLFVLVSLIIEHIVKMVGNIQKKEKSMKYSLSTFIHIKIFYQILIHVQTTFLH